MIEMPAADRSVAVACGRIHNLTLDFNAEIPRRQPDVAFGEVEEILRQSPHE
jgi:hypothetical protein